MDRTKISLHFIALATGAQGSPKISERMGLTNGC